MLDLNTFVDILGPCGISAFVLSYIDKNTIKRERLHSRSCTDINHIRLNDFKAEGTLRSHLDFDPVQIYAKAEIAIGQVESAKCNKECIFDAIAP